MPFKDTIKLRFGHSLVLGNTPQAVELETLGEIIEKESKTDVSSFGLFETASPNYTTYYPDVTAEDLTPRDEEFILPTYRALSEVIVHRSWNPVDFGVKNVLKKSMSLLKGQTVYADHETALGNALGAIGEVAWQNSYKISDKGILVPAGINAQLKIDGKSNPRIARGILMNPPSIHSTSVTVQFMWEKSHPNISDEEFWRGLGKFDKEGNMFRRIVTKIVNYHEISLVSHGADPYAQKVGSDGKIVNPTYADISNNSAAKKDEKVFFFDFKSEILQNSEQTIPDESNATEDQVENTNNNDQNKNTPTMTFLESLALELGLPQTATEEQVKAALTEKLSSLTSAQTSVTSLNQEKTEWEKDKPAYTSLKAFETDVLTKKRAEVTRLYKLTVKTADQPIIDLINNAAYPALEVLEKQYGTQAENIAPLTCSKCGSHEVSRASSKPEDPKDPKDEGDDSTKELTVDEAYEHFSRKANTSTSAKLMH